MPLQGPLVIVSESPAMRLVTAIAKAGAFPVVEARWVDAATAVISVEPAAVVIAQSNLVDPKIAAMFAQQVAHAEPFIPVVATVRDELPLPFPAALPVAADWPVERLIARLAAAQRVRELHATVLRRMKDFDGDRAMPCLPETDPLEDATVLVLGRGRSYPSLSVGIGERVSVVGALSVEAAGRRLAARDIHGIVIGDGFSPKIIDAFLQVLSEDARFRDLAVGVLGDGFCPESMPNMVREREPARLVAHVLPLVRLLAFSARLKRMLSSLERGGAIDPATGLLNESSFGRDLSRAVDEAADRGGSLSLARIAFEGQTDRRSSLDAARIVSRFLRKADFACRQDDGSILTAFPGTDLRTAHVVARRLASTLKHAMLRTNPDPQFIAPNVTLATLKPTDSVLTLLARVSQQVVAAE